MGNNQSANEKESIRESRRESKGYQRHQNVAYANNLSMSIINYMIDTIDQILDVMKQRVTSIPITIKVYCKALYDKLSKKGKTKAQIY